MTEAGTLDKRTDEQAAVLPFPRAADGQASLLVVLKDIADSQRQILDRLNQLETLTRASVKSDDGSYTTDEVAELVGRAAWTVRQWCNQGRIKARKVVGRGRQGEWRIDRAELVRLQGEGPKPEGTFDSHGKRPGSHRA